MTAHNSEECGPLNCGRVPLPLLDRRGGRDINKSREASTKSGRGGCSNVVFEFEQPPRLCRQWLLRNILFLAQPPLLSRRGNGAHPNSFTPSMTAPADRGRSHTEPAPAVQLTRTGGSIGLNER